MLKECIRLKAGGLVKFLDIIEEKIKGKNLVFTRYYDISIARKGIEHEKVMDIFPQFDKVYEIEKEMLKEDIGFELFYRLSNNTYFSIATIPKDSRVLIIHAVEYKRDLRYRFKQK